jgi:hypothetical protein
MLLLGLVAGYAEGKARIDAGDVDATDCSVTELTTTTAIGFPDMHIVLNVNGTHTP